MKTQPSAPVTAPGPFSFKGWVRTSLIDFPEHIATVIFTPGCNFRCPMCHNADLVLRSASLPTLTEAELHAFLDRRAGKITGLVVTGGESTLQPDLAGFLARVRDYDIAIKLDTNGYRPDVLAALLDAGLLDYVAMDVKAPPAKYALLAGVPDLDVMRIARSLALLNASGVPYELRTTVVPGFLDVADIEPLTRWVAEQTISSFPPPSYALQQFRGGQTLGPNLANAAPYPLSTLQTMAQHARRWLPQVIVRA